MIRGVGSGHRGLNMQIKFMFAPVIGLSLSHKSYRPLRGHQGNALPLACMGMFAGSSRFHCGL